MTFYLVIYVAGHLFAYLGPLSTSTICEQAISGFDEVKNQPVNVHRYCDVRAKPPMLGEIENAD